MAKARSERSRWVTIFMIPRPGMGETTASIQSLHDQARVVVVAFEAVGRVVRVEPAKYGQGLVFKARKA